MKLIVFDVDGVLTNNTYYYDKEGDSGRAFHLHDGYGFRLLRAIGFDIVVISGDKHVASISRISRFPYVKGYWGVVNKRDIFNELTANKDYSSTIFIGNDPNDLILGKEVNRFYCPKDAHWLIKKYAVTLNVNGGNGVALEVAETLFLEEGDPKALEELYSSWYE
jgi:3-deoxy-D-manno-octulosonate 8-phosphate phosphatase (KDO 8-P phosphatase)